MYGPKVQKPGFWGTCIALGGAMVALALLGASPGSSSGKEPVPPPNPKVAKRALPRTWLLAGGAVLILTGIAFSPLTTVPYARRRVRLPGRRRRRRRKVKRPSTWPYPPPTPVPPSNLDSKEGPGGSSGGASNPSGSPPSPPAGG